jgi:DNA (cytosine-5)-methyltransferase 1
VAYTIAAREAKGVSMLESQTNYIAQQGVRRLTPLECQRLQGFPDWWYDGLDLADSHIYRQMGNAVCVPVAEYIGHRINTLEAIR